MHVAEGVGCVQICSDIEVVGYGNISTAVAVLANTG